jgi:peroxiredoxin
MKYKFSISLFLLLLTFCGFAGDGIYSVQLKDCSEKYHALEEYKGNEATVIVYLLADCPASQYYSLTLNNISKKYTSDKIKLVGIFAGKFTKITEVRKFVSDYKIEFPVLLDKEMKSAGVLKATTAPQAFLVDKNGHIQYSGRIDDTYYAPGRKRNAVTTNDLTNAIDALLLHKPIRHNQTKAIGCILEY